VIDDPTKDNGGSQSLAALYTAKGEDFVRKLLKDQAPIIANDSRQGTEWLADGRYAIGIGTDRNLMADLKTKGLGKSVEQLKGDGIYLLTYSASAMQNAPHPND